MPSRQGLTSREAQRLQKQYGPNKLESSARIMWPGVLLRQFTSLFILILLGAGLVTGLVLNEWIDATVIIAAVLLNTFLGFIQEYRAEKSLEALKNLLTPMVTVIRDGKRQTIPAEQIVRGDLVLLGFGDTVPADGRLIFADSLTVNEAILTGESMPVEKKADGLPSTDYSKRTAVVRSPSAIDSSVFMGTTITSGVGQMIVTAVGQSTRLGDIASSLRMTKADKTPLQKAIDRLSKTLTVVILAISFLVFTLGSLTGRNAAEMFGLSVAIAVAAIPEGLAVTLTVILSLGMRRILKRKALVRTLAAAETLGSTTVICTDKTGTITEGRMRVINAISSLDDEKDEGRGTRDEGKTKFLQPSAFGLHPSAALTLSALLCNDLRDPLEIAMDEWSKSVLGTRRSSRGLSPEGHQALGASFPRLDEIPFSPERKYIATLHEIRDKGQGLKAKGGQTDEATRFPSSLSPHPLALLLVSGAPEVLLEKTTLSKKEKQQWHKKFEQLGSQGLRLVAFAWKEYKAKGQAFVPRSSGRGGLKAKGKTNISGPQPSALILHPSEVEDLSWLGLLTFEDPIRAGAAEALRKAQDLGLKIHVITGDYLPTTKAVVDKLGVPDITIHARVTPEEKLQIVKKLQDQGEVVAMTGDGVNDAPALKKADIGIVVSTASDVSKETADMVLLDDNFGTITAAIIEGRSVRINLKRVITYLLSDNFSEIVLITGALLLGLPAPLLATQLLWINFISDGFPAIALAVDTVEKKEVQHPVVDHALLTAPMKWIIGLVSWITGIFAFSLFIAVHTTTQDLTLARTIAFATLGTTTLLFVFSVRSLTTPVWRTKLFENHWLTLAVIVGWLLQLAPIYVPALQPIFHTTPLSAPHWFIVLAAGFLTVIVIELAKWRFRLNHASRT